MGAIPDPGSTTASDTIKVTLYDNAEAICQKERCGLFLPLQLYIRLTGVNKLHYEAEHRFTTPVHIHQQIGSIGSQTE